MCDEDKILAVLKLMITITKMTVRNDDVDEDEDSDFVDEDEG